MGKRAKKESGAIVFHVAERHAGLFPQDAKARARAIMWMFAALDTMEPPIVQLEVARYLERETAWHEQRLPLVEDRIRTRLDELSRRLGEAEWLDGTFSAGDLLMVQVLRRLGGSGLHSPSRALARAGAAREHAPVRSPAWPAVRGGGRSLPGLRALAGGPGQRASAARAVHRGTGGGTGRLLPVPGGVAVHPRCPLSQAPMMPGSSPSADAMIRRAASTAQSYYAARGFRGLLRR